MKFDRIRIDLAGDGLSVAKGDACQIEAPITNSYIYILQPHEKKACQNSITGETGTHVTKRD